MKNKSRKNKIKLKTMEKSGPYCLKFFLLLFFIFSSVSINLKVVISNKRFIRKYKRNSNHEFNFNNNTKKNKKIYDENFRKYEKYEKDFNKNTTCDNLDPINVFNLRLKNGPIEICKNEKTNHICYINHEGYYNDIFVNKNGVLCMMENIVLDPSKLSKSHFVYLGPVDSKNKGFPILTKGFFNTKCNPNPIKFDYSKKMYNFYFDSWDYDYNIETEKEPLEELAPGKTVFFISRTQDSPNLFHGNCEMINIISMLYLFNLAPEEVQIVILSGIEIPEDPFYEMYKNMFSEGYDPINVNNLKKKYKISKAINVPTNWDSPPFVYIPFPKCDSATRTYQLYNDFVDKYMNLTKFNDTFISNESYYYPESIIKSHENGIKFTKIITIQWRKVWPEGRRGQFRILANAKNLADKLVQVLPKNFLVRLINTAALPYKDQIALMRNTDYFIGIHGAGLALSIFLPKESIMHEIYREKVNDLLNLMSSLSGHLTYSDLIKSKRFMKEGSENIEFDENEFAQKVLEHMKENNFF